MTFFSDSAMPTSSTSSAPASAPALNDKQREPAENVRYGNLMVDGETRFKLGAFRISKGHVNEAALIAKLDENPVDDDGVDSRTRFKMNVLVGTYNAGKGDHFGSHFINLSAKSKNGDMHEIGFCRLEDNNPKHADVIAALVDDPDSATSIVRACTLSYVSAVPVVHEYDF